MNDAVVSREELLQVALGHQNADVVIVGGRVISVTNRNVFRADIGIKGDRIALIGDCSECIGDSTNIIEVDDAFLTPGLIDGHIHIESTMLVPAQFARAVLPFGTTAIVTDPHELANVLGIQGFKLMFLEARNTPLKVFGIGPSSVPASPGFETPGAQLGAKELQELLTWEGMVGINEVSNLSRLKKFDPDYISTILLAYEMGKTVDGSIPTVRGGDLNAFINIGVQSEHEAPTLDLVLERLNLGLRFMVREGSTAKYLQNFVGLLSHRTYDPRTILLVTDDKHPRDLLNGHMDLIVRDAISLGVDPLVALQMVTVNPAEYFGLNNIGCLTPGKIADILVIPDLQEFKATQVLTNGKVVAKNGKLTVSIDLLKYPDWSVNTVKIHRKIHPADFVIKTTRNKKTHVNLIEINEKTLIQNRIEQVSVRNHQILSDTDLDILKIAVIERHGKSKDPRIALGLIHGFGLNSGAFGSSIAHDTHNLIVVGTTDEDMAAVANRLVDLQGGLVIAQQQQILGELALPVGGLMSTHSVEQVAEALKGLHKIMQAELGCLLHAPFMTLSFQTISSRSWIKLTDMGLFDGTKLVSLETEPNSNN